ncbi:MAG: c-type cytochrome [Terriglobales bacterium]
MPSLGSRRARIIAVAGLLCLGLAGCRQDMYNQPKYVPMRPSTFFRDGRSERPAVPGTVARDELNDNDAVYQGRVGGSLVDTLPVPLTPELLARGRERYNIFCAPCHARVGDGNGMIVQRGFSRPPTFHQDRLRDAPVGHFFDVITHGWGAMPDYAAQVPVADRWAIVAYIRALQLSQHAPASLVPADHQADLNQPLRLPATEFGKAAPHGVDYPKEVQP